MLPTHGFGSFCSATPTSGDASTVGEQTRVNPALTLDEQDYVDTLLAGLDAYPAYYAHMGPINRRGPAPVDLSPPEPVEPAELRRRIEAGEWVVDLRDRTAFAAGHLAGSLGLRAGHQLRHLPGLALPLRHPADTDRGDPRAGRAGPPRAGPHRHRRARRRRHRRHRHPRRRAALRSYPVTDFAGLAKALQQGPVQVLDTRRNDERARGLRRRLAAHPAARAAPTASTRSRRARCGSTAARVTGPRSPPRSSTTPAARSC